MTIPEGDPLRGTCQPYASSQTHPQSAAAMEAAPRFVRLAAALLAALAIFAAPTAARDAELDINGPAEFIASMEDGLDALQSIGLRAYVTTQIGTLSADLEPTCTTFTGPQAGPGQGGPTT